MITFEQIRTYFTNKVTVEKLVGNELSEEEEVLLKGIRGLNGDDKDYAGNFDRLVNDFYHLKSEGYNPNGYTAQNQSERQEILRIIKPTVDFLEEYEQLLKGKKKRS